MHKPRPSLLVLNDAPTEVQFCEAAPSPERRGLIRALSLGAAAMVLLPWRWAQAKKIGMRIAQMPALQKVGGSAVVTVKGQELLLIRDTATSIRAIDPMCTHKKCKVFYQAASRDLGCKCHKSKFSLSGEVMGGPAPRALRTFAAKIKGEQIIIDLG